MRSAPQLTQHPTLAMERVLAVLSPNNLVRLPLLKRMLLAVFPHCDVVAPKDLAHLHEVVQRSATTHRLVFAVGGDGTLHRVLNALSPQEQLLGLIPSGTGNDFARTIGQPRNLPQAIARLTSLTPQPTDFGLINGIRYHNSAGFGLDSATLRLREVSNNLLTRNYNAAFLLALAGMKAMNLQLQEPGHAESGSFFWLLAMNTQLIGGGSRIAPQADIADGKLDLLLVRKTNKLNLVRHMPAALKGNHVHLPMLSYRQFERLSCDAQAPLDYLAVDGELYYCGERRVSIECRPAGMQFLR